MSHNKQGVGVLETAALLKGLSVFPRRFKSEIDIIGNGVGDDGVMLQGRSLYQGEFGEFAAFALNAGSGSSNYWI